jgi:hypothetical protein
MLKELAAFCAADSIDEKKPDAGCALGVASPLSRVGVNGAETIFESLLGPMVTELDRLLRCALIAREEEVPFVPAPWPALPQKDLLSGDDWPDALASSVGVGGVFTMTGAGLSPLGGVRGGRFVSTFG